jgi:hypothetical protein
MTTPRKRGVVGKHDHPYGCRFKPFACVGSDPDRRGQVRTVRACPAPEPWALDQSSARCPAASRRTDPADRTCPGTAAEPGPGQVPSRPGPGPTSGCCACEAEESAPGDQSSGARESCSPASAVRPSAQNPPSLASLHLSWMQIPQACRSVRVPRVPKVSAPGLPADPSLAGHGAPRFARSVRRTGSCTGKACRTGSGCQPVRRRSRCRPSSTRPQTPRARKEPRRRQKPAAEKIESLCSSRSYPTPPHRSRPPGAVVKSVLPLPKGLQITGQSRTSLKINKLRHLGIVKCKIFRHVRLASEIDKREPLHHNSPPFVGP